MSLNEDGAGRVTTSLARLLNWYSTPLSMIFALGLVAAFVAALLERSGIGLGILVATVAVVIPLKLGAQRSELHSHMAGSNEFQARLQSQVESAITRTGLNNVVKGFRKADRQNLRKIRTRMNRLQQAHDLQLDELRSEVRVLHAKLAAAGISPAKEMSLDGRYEIVRSQANHGQLHEAGIEAVYRAVLQPGDCAIDGGAHSGKHTISMAEAVAPDGRVIAFEPSPLPFAALTKNVAEAQLENVMLIDHALSDTVDGDVEFLVFAERPGVSGFKRRSDSAGDLDAESISVKTTTLDVSAGNEANVGFVKLDVEGAELQALAGGRQLVASHQPVIHVEASYISWDAFGYGPAELFEFAETHNYDIVDITGAVMDSVTTLDDSFRNGAIWDYFLIPESPRGIAARSALVEHTARNYPI